MAKNEPNKPDDEKIMPANETTTDEKNKSEQPLEAGGETTPPEITTNETVAPAYEGETLPDPER